MAFGAIIHSFWKSGQGRDITIVIPDDYSHDEEYIIILDRMKGKEPQIVDGSYRFEFTREGIAYNTFAPFRKYHNQSIETQSGQQLEISNGKGATWVINSGEYAGRLAFVTSNHSPTLHGVGSVSGSDDGATMRMRTWLLDSETVID